MTLKLIFFFAAPRHWQRASARPAGGGGGQAVPSAGRSKLFLHCVTCELDVEFFLLLRRAAALHWQRAALRAGGGGGQAAPAAGRSSDITYEIT